jgi:hypothetical protein
LEGGDASAILQAVEDWQVCEVEFLGVAFEQCERDTGISENLLFTRPLKIAGVEIHRDPYDTHPILPRHLVGLSGPILRQPSQEEALKQIGRVAE